jgi:hypothetical protein
VITSIALMVAAALYDAVFGPGWWEDSKPLQSATLFGITAAVMISCSYGIRARPRPVHTITLSIGIWAAIAGWFLSLAPIWEIFTSFRPNAYSLESRLGDVAAIAYLFAAAIAFDGLMHLFALRGVAVWTRRISILAGYTSAAAVSSAIFFDEYSMDPVDRVVLAGLAIATGGAIATVVLRSLFPEFRVGGAEPDTGETSAEIACPACRTSHRIPLKRRVECPTCRLGIYLRLDAPKCTCGYDLTGLESPACPECGTPVEKRHTWALTAHG